MTRPCIVAGCPHLVRHGSRCPGHQLPSLGRWSWRTTSQRVLERDGYRCAYCHGYADTVDHIVPRAAGGTDDERNLVAACRKCNSRKGAS
jgi:5-methylcytosine-specific restriction endonuclease McrA